MSHWKSSLAALAVASLGATALAAPVIDGSRDAEYGPAIAVQGIGTGFGNSTLGQVGPANGSELDAGYGIVTGGNLYLFLAGNLETNFNKLEIFIDSIAGGQNKLQGDNPDVDFNGLNRMGDDGSGNGLRFDVGFGSDYYVTTTGGNNPVEWFANFAETKSVSLGGTGGFIGGSGAGNMVLNGNNGIIIGFNNSNTLGVNSLGNPFDSDPATVTTGIELLIPLSVIGNPLGEIKITTFVNGSGHDFASNQFLGALPAGTGNLGEPRAIDLQQQAGNQYFSVFVPEPASLCVAGLVGISLLSRRRAAR